MRKFLFKRFAILNGHANVVSPLFGNELEFPKTAVVRHHPLVEDIVLLADEIRTDALTAADYPKISHFFRGEPANRGIGEHTAREMHRDKSDILKRSRGSAVRGLSDRGHAIRPLFKQEARDVDIMQCEIHDHDAIRSRRHQAEAGAVEEIHLADRAVLELLFDAEDDGIETENVSWHEDAVLLSGEDDEFLCFLCRERYRLFQEHVLS